MKVICIKNTYVDSGFFKKTTKKVNLTVGKDYNVHPILNSGWRDDMMRSDHQFLVFNDAKKWSSYPMDMFVEAE